MNLRSATTSAFASTHGGALSSKFHHSKTVALVRSVHGVKSWQVTSNPQQLAISSLNLVSSLFLGALGAGENDTMLGAHLGQHGGGGPEHRSTSSRRAAWNRRKTGSLDQLDLTMIKHEYNYITSAQCSGLSWWWSEAGAAKPDWKHNKLKSSPWLG